MLKYFDDFVGKNLGIGVFGELMLYFSVNMVPMALPLAVLVSSLMTYGRMGEHFELTAIKSAGISLVRVLMPTFVFVCVLSVGAFFFNNEVVPFANLRAYSLLYDIKQTKPAMDLKEGQFYDGLPNYSIKVKKKHSDGITMNDMVIYDHTDTQGNMKVIMADSCRMYTFVNDRFLMMELYKGNYYVEEEVKNQKKARKPKDVDINRFVRTSFDRMDLVFSLSSFDLDRTNMDLFAGNRYMKSVKKLTESIDSMSREMRMAHFKLYGSVAGMYKLHQGGYIKPTHEVLALANRDTLEQLEDEHIADSLRQTTKKDSIKIPTSTRPEFTKPQTSIASSSRLDNRITDGEIYNYIETKKERRQKYDTLYVDSVTHLLHKAEMDSVYSDAKKRKELYTKATSNARSIKATLSSTLSRFKYFKSSIDAHVVEKYKKYAQAFACIVMFLIGAPLGAIIKRGGLGVPVIVSVFFFVIFYVLTSASDKWAKAGLVDGLYAAWVANVVLLPAGLFFLKQARKDAKLFDTDFYNVWFDKLLVWWEANKGRFNWLPGM